MSTTRVAGCDDHTTYTAGCTGCRARAAARGRDRCRRMAYGIWQPAHTPAIHAHRHIRALVDDHGMSLRQIAAAANVGRGSVDRIAADPDVFATRSTIDKILDVQPQRPFDGRNVNAYGAARRLQALTAIGYNTERLAHLLDERPNRVRAARRMAKPHIRAGRHHAITELFQRLSGTPGPDDDARAYARARNWAPPLMWDDDEHLDDPNRQPRWTARQVSERAVKDAIAGRVSRYGLNEAELYQIIAALTRAGWADQRIGDHLRWAGGGKAGKAQVRQWRLRHGVPPGATWRQDTKNLPAKRSGCDLAA